MLLSSGYRATVEGRPNVHSSSTAHNSDRATSMGCNCTCRVGKVQSIFISSQLKVIPLFRVLPTPVQLPPDIYNYVDLFEPSQLAGVVYSICH